MFFGVGVGILVFQIVFLATYRLCGFLTILLEAELCKMHPKQEMQEQKKKKLKKFKWFWRKNKKKDKDSGAARQYNSNPN